MRGKPLSTFLFAAFFACAPSETPAGTDGLRVALLTPGPISDQAWNGEAYAGLLAIRDSLGARISHIQTRTPAEFDENFRAYGRQGFTLVIGHGFEFQDAALRIAPSFPATTFAVTSSTASAPNVAGIEFRFDQPSYLAGMAAAGVTRSGVLGAIGGTELPPVRAGFDAFAAGARSVDRRVRVVTSYLGNWEDVSAGREQALALINQGADVIFQNADAAGLGAFQAARETGRALVIGANADQAGVAPDVVLASAVIDVPRAFLAVARAVRDGGERPAVFRLGAEAGAVRLALNPLLAQRLPVAVRQRIDSAWSAMKRGTWRGTAATPP